MKGNNSGRGAGLTLALILIVALVAAWLAVTQLPPRVEKKDINSQPPFMERGGACRLPPLPYCG